MSLLDDDGDDDGNVGAIAVKVCGADDNKVVDGLAVAIDDGCDDNDDE